MKAQKHESLQHHLTRHPNVNYVWVNEKLEFVTGPQAGYEKVSRRDALAACKQLAELNNASAAPGDSASNEELIAARLEVETLRKELAEMKFREQLSADSLEKMRSIGNISPVDTVSPEDPNQPTAEELAQAQLLAADMSKKSNQKK